MFGKKRISIDFLEEAIEAVSRRTFRGPLFSRAFVYEELARRHHFNDGNKRTAHVFAKIALFLMDYHLKIEYKEAVKFIIEVAKHKSTVSFVEIKKWIKTHATPIPLEYKNDIHKVFKRYNYRSESMKPKSKLTIEEKKN